MKLDGLMTKIITGAAPCVLQLDIPYSDLPAEFMRGYSDKAEAVRAFNRVVIGTVCDIIPAISVSVPVLLKYGLETISDAVSYAREKGLYTIVDAKCSGEPCSAGHEAELYLSEICADCVTVCPYYGVDGILPFVEKGASVFVIAHSETGAACDVQELVAGLRPVYRAVCEKVSRSGEKKTGDMGYSEIGVVLGGLSNNILSELRRTYKKMPFLITGYDAMRTSAHDINGAFDMKGLGGFVGVGRALTLPGGDGIYSERLRTSAENIVRDLKLCF